jgi:Outer membrane lipoprotein-sorting protein
MSLKRAILILMLSASPLLPPTAGAMIPPSLQLGPDARQDLQQIQDYLNTIRTVQARFLQTSSNGGQASGQLYMSRPGKLRVEYTPPPAVLVVADGTFLIYYDKALDQVSYVPLSASPAGILLDKRINLDDPALTITDVQDAGDLVRVSLVRTESAGEGTLTLFFTRSPWQLAQWEVTDAQGITTRVSLADPVFGTALDSKLFEFENPRLLQNENQAGNR